LKIEKNQVYTKEILNHKAISLDMKVDVHFQVISILNIAMQ